MQFVKNLTSCSSPLTNHYYPPRFDQFATASPPFAVVFSLLRMLFAVVPPHRQRWKAPPPLVYTLYLVAKPYIWHPQGIHNVAGQKDNSAYMSYDYLDAHLTDLGWNLVDNLRMHVQRTGFAKKIDLLTAVGVFGGEHYTDGISAPPLMIQKAFNCGRPPVSSLGAPPFLAVESCREHLGEHTYDKRSITEYRPVFPAIDFSLIENHEDVLWKPGVGEKNEEVAARSAKFIDWLWTREEKDIAIVSHSGFFYRTLRNLGQDCHPAIQQEISKDFANCELRSVVLVDRSMLGMAISSANFPGKTLPGPNKPIDQIITE